MRKHVTPADPKACIPDPSRGRDLPPGGAEIDWTPYWAGMEARGEVSVRDVAVERAVVGLAPREPDPAPSVPRPPQDEPERADPDPLAGAAAETTGVSLMITKRQRADLRARGFSDDQIAEMTPAQAHHELGLT